MANPPRDAGGRVIPYDDPEIPDDAYVVRYVTSQWLAPDGRGGRRLSTGAFSPTSKNRDPYRGMSVDLLEPMLKDGLPMSGRMTSSHEGVVKLRVGALRTLGLQVGHDPLPDNPYHTAIWEVTKRNKKEIWRLAEWIVKPSSIAE